MKIEQTRWTPKDGWANGSVGSNLSDAQLVFLFGGTNVVTDAPLTREVRDAYPEAYVFGCSTAGEICDTEVTDGALVATAVRLDATRIEHAEVSMSDVETSRNAGERLAQALPAEGLVHVFVLSDGLHVNGSELVAGLTERLPSNVSITGGLSGDGDRFSQTFVILNGSPKADAVGVLGFYGAALKVGYASLGGWDAFGPERLITKSEGNVLYELDGRSALQLYKTYLGEHAAGLPATGLLFPLSVRLNGDDIPVVRTILGIDEEAQSMTFAGDVPTGAYARLMKANFDRLIDGAVGAAKGTYETVGSSSPELAILISCVGRKLVLKQRVEEEVEGVREVLGDRTVLAGFYSYGEISPFTPSAKCELHNQTMTITTFSERAA